MRKRYAFAGVGDVQGRVLIPYICVVNDYLSLAAECGFRKGKSDIILWNKIAICACQTSVRYIFALQKCDMFSLGENVGNWGEKKLCSERISMIRDVKREKIKELLLKAAKGYQVAEVTVEYAEVNGKMQVTKRKETKKEVPGDLKALQMLLESEKINADAFSELSDEELEREKCRLLKKLEKGDEYGKIGSGSKGACRKETQARLDEGN